MIVVEIDILIDTFLDSSKNDENMSDEFFDELKNVVNRHKNESFNKIKRNIRKQKLEKINKRNGM